MHRTLICAATAAASLIVFSLTMGAAAHADQYAGPGFSGVAFTADNGGQPQRLGPVNVDRDGFRMTMKNDGGNFGALIRWDDPTAYSLMIDQRMYIKVSTEEMGMDAYEARPCVDYASGRKLGTERLNGRMTEKWRCTGELTPKQGETPADSTTWYDPELAFEIKVINDDGSAFEIRDIAVGRQDSALFKIPAGFQELDMNALMQRQQQ